MSNDVEELEAVQKACKAMIKQLSSVIVTAEKFDNSAVITRLISAQSKLLFAKFAVNQLLRDEFVEVNYDDDECSNKSICDECPC